MDKKDVLKDRVEHIDITRYEVGPLVDAMARMGFQAKNLAKAARIFETMARDPDCTVVLSLAGSPISAGLKRVIHELVARDLVDAIVSTGAIIVDMDFLEALGNHHYQADAPVPDDVLRDLRIDRIYDTYIDDDALRACDLTVARIAEELPRRPHSSREFLREMGRWLDAHGDLEARRHSVIYEAYRRDVPIFVPAFSDCSAGFGLVHHQRWNPEGHLTIDSVKDFRELCDLIVGSKETGIVVLGGGVPKNFIQDAVLGMEVDRSGRPKQEEHRHKYAVQVSVADVRDGGLSGSTFVEARSWGKVDTFHEQMVFSEASIAFPLLAGYVLERVEGREAKRLARRLEGG